LMYQLLLVGFFLGLLLGLLIGRYWRDRRSGSWRRRAPLEDALKHLYDREYRGHVGTVESLAGVLGVSLDFATELLTRLETEGLVELVASKPRLTDRGRRDALRTIRIHRLWEQHLAEHTGFAEREWHGEADLREHRITPDEADALAADMGHPRFDPHGDPIPTADGEVPPARGQPLTNLAVGQQGVIVHVEDEPASVYAELLSHGLSLGMHVALQGVTADRVRIVADGRACELSHLAAANLSVEEIADTSVPATGWSRLSDVGIGNRATVLGILPACRGNQRRRLLDLGLVPGTEVEAVRRSPGGEPTAYRIRGALIALRNDQTDLIRVGTSDMIASA
jgi:DtxR family Mn-dependent transcriptional regulator